MTAIYKRELSSYFNSMIGYVFIAVLVFLQGSILWPIICTTVCPSSLIRCTV